MTVKETLIEALREVGYDFITAAEHATKCLDEFRASGKKQQTIVVSGYMGKAHKVFELRRK